MRQFIHIKLNTLKRGSILVFLIEKITLVLINKSFFNKTKIIKHLNHATITQLNN